MNKLSQTIQNIVNKSVTEAKSGRMGNNRAVQSGLKAFENLQVNDRYNRAFLDTLNDFHLWFNESIKNDLRNDINMDLGSDAEECIVADAEDLVFLDKHKSVRFTDPSDVEDLPNLKTLQNFGKRLASHLRPQVASHSKPQTLSRCKTTDDLPF